MQNYLHLETLKKIRLDWLLLLSLSSFICFPLKAQKLSSQAIFSNSETKITSANFINDLFLDKNGLLWMATDQGIIRWDGVHQTIFNDAPDQKKFRLHGERFVEIMEDENQNIILSTATSPPSFEQFNLDTETSQLIDINAIKTPNENLIDVCSLPGKGVFIAIHGRRSIHIYQCLPQEGFVEINSQRVNFDLSPKRKSYTTNGTDHWIAIENQGVYRLANGTWKQALDFQNEDIPQPSKPKILHCDQAGNLWFNFRDHLELWQAPAGQLALEKIETPFTQIIKSLREDRHHKLVFIAGEYPAALSEIWQYNQGEWLDMNWLTESFPRASTLYSNDFASSIFIATPSNVHHIRQEQDQVKSYLRRTLKSDEWGTIIKGINEDDQGQIYFLSENDYLFRYNPQGQKDSMHPVLDTLRINALSKDNFYPFNCGGELIKDQKGFFWFKICSRESFSGILIRFDPRTEEWKFFPHRENIRSLDLEPGKGLWIGHHDTENIGQLSFFDFASESYIPLDSLGIKCRFSIPRYCYRGQDSTIWIGTTQGLAKVDLKNKRFNLYHTENTTLPEDHIITIHQEAEDLLLLGTNGGGLVFFQISNQDITVHNKEKGLANDNVCGILPTGNGNYWLSTFDGLSYFDRTLGYFTNFNTTSGFNYNEFNRYAFYKSRSGAFYFGNLNGANSFYEADLLENEEQNRVGLSALKIYFGDNDSTIVQTKGLRTLKNIVLPYDFTYIQFDLYHTDYLQKNGQKVLTRLAGYDSQWEAIDPNIPLRYRNLRKGIYPLYLAAVQSFPKNLPQDPILTIEVKPPFFLTWWFILSLAALLVGIFWFWNKRRFNRLKEEEAQKSETNLKFAELELQALQAQLNPHFIFNSLGAIQYFIKTNEKEKADAYLTSFARLMRLFLESSKNKYITLAEEIEMLRLYIQLEQLRFKNSFTASITLDPELDPAQIYIPSLLLQPFIENAINHGLFHKEGPGNLALDFSPMEDEGLLVTLEDNGIGREKAQEIKKRSVLNYKSRAMQIIDERREVLSKVEDYHIDIEIKDLYHPNKNAAGTKVIIKIPEIE